MTVYILKLVSLLGGLALFLFGMDTMGSALERTAGGKLQTILAKMSSSVPRGFLLGLAVTAVIQSSSATTVMVVGFVNSGIMTLHQAVGVIILFSYSGATTGGLQILELARQRGIRTILVTRFQKSPAAKLSDVVLRCGSNESPFQFGSVPAKVAQLVVIDAVFQEYCLRNRESCEESVQAIASALSVMHV